MPEGAPERDAFRLFERLLDLPDALSPSAFRLGTAAGDSLDPIIYDQAAGKLYYDADGNGSAAQILFATFSAGTPLNQADFVGYI